MPWYDNSNWPHFSPYFVSKKEDANYETLEEVKEAYIEALREEIKFTKAFKSKDADGWHEFGAGGAYEIQNGEMLEKCRQGIDFGVEGQVLMRFGHKALVWLKGHSCNGAWHGYSQSHAVLLQINKHDLGTEIIEGRFSRDKMVPNIHKIAEYFGIGVALSKMLVDLDVISEAKRDGKTILITKGEGKQ